MNRELADPCGSARLLRQSRSVLRMSIGVACLVLIGLSPGTSAVCGEPLGLADPTVRIEEAWTPQRFRGETEYEKTAIGGVAAIRAIGRNSASGLYRRVAYQLTEYPWLEWTWRIDRLQLTADIRVKDREDFAAAIFLIFDQPGMLDHDAPTLAYVWTSDLLPENAIVDSPHRPSMLRYLVVRSGGNRLGQWVRERRNVLEDFSRAFGREPPQIVEVLAIFTDNDQTGEPVEAYYGAITALPR